MTEDQLLAEIKKLPGHTVFYGRDGFSVTIANQINPQRVRQASVWLGRKSTVMTLQEILEGRLP